MAAAPYSPPPPHPTRSFVRYRPQWLLVCGALLLAGACVFPWMRLFAFPFTPSAPQVAAAGGIVEEPLWFACSLGVLFLTVWTVPYRYYWLTALVFGFAVKLWFVYNTLTDWIRFNEMTANDPGDRPAPIAQYGLGWYCLIAGLSIFAGTCAVAWWRRRNSE